MIATLAFLAAVSPAHADVPDPRVEILNESELGPLDTSPFSEPCPTTYQWGDPTNKDVVWKPFTNDQGGRTNILLDEYSPMNVPPEVPEPAVVLVHGGGTFQGCKSALNHWAIALANSYNFIVFSIDYRLSCTSADNPSPEELPLCYWTYPKLDHDTGLPNAAEQDLRDAVDWAKRNAARYHQFNTHVALAGSSGGGTVVYESQQSLVMGDSHRADVIAGLSGLTEFAEMSNSHYTCDDSPQSAYCWTMPLHYHGCDIRTDPPSQTCFDQYHAASPPYNDNYTSNGPPVFIANADSELMPMLDAQDFYSELNGIGVSDYLCTVEASNVHAKGYLFTWGCNTDQRPPLVPSVLDDVVTFFRPYVGGI